LTTHTVVIGDSRDMSHIKDKSVHLVVTSPPYWNVIDYDCKGDIAAHKHKDIFLEELQAIWRELGRVVVDGGMCAINVEDSACNSKLYGRAKEICMIGEYVKGLEYAGFDLFSRIIWKKAHMMITARWCNYKVNGNGYPPYFRVNPNWAYVFVFRKRGSKRKIPQEIKDKCRISKKEYNQLMDAVWDIPSVSKNDVHKSMFPEKLVERLIRMYSVIGDTVLDPFLGSGTTMKVAKDLGRNSIGYEINDKYLPVIKKRLEWMDSASADNQYRLVRHGRGYAS